MKLLLSWIFDHIQSIDCAWDIQALIKKFNTHTAEVEHVSSLSLDPKDLVLLKLVEANPKPLFQDNTSLTVALPLSDRDDLKVGLFYLALNKNSQTTWATFKDFGLDKEGFFSPLFIDQKGFESQEWKKAFKKDDIILDVDNKSLTNRPDMWSHRGFAREIAFLSNSVFIDKNQLLEPLTVETCSATSLKNSDASFQVLAPNFCKAFSLTKFDNIKNQPPHPFIAIRLALIGSKPISAVVDATNYVMNDWGNPIHAFDAQTIPERNLLIRQASEGETLKLLDGSSVTLSDQDHVIASNNQALALAGIKGGLDSGVSLDTTEILFEAANFDATLVRLSSTRLKTRTDSSARFEKTLDRTCLDECAKRFSFLLNFCGINHSASKIYYWHSPVEPTVINVSNNFLKTFSGLDLKPALVKECLEKIGFEVLLLEDENFKIVVPSFRATKNVTTPQDIVEEISRLIGYDQVPVILPAINKKPYNFSAVQRIRALKNFFAYGCKMQEMYNYAFFDQEFIERIGFKPSVEQPELQNPVSENYKIMISSLVPGLLKNASQNKTSSDELRFFEQAKIWQTTSGALEENNYVAGVIVSKKRSVGFLEVKEMIEQAISTCQSKKLSWAASQNFVQVFAKGSRTAEITLDSKVVGYAGELEEQCLINAGFDQGCSGVFFEIALKAFTEQVFSDVEYVAVSKFQESFLDFSVLAPYSVSLDDIVVSIKECDPLIEEVMLIDLFNKKDWVDKRSLTVRAILQNYKNNIEGTDIDRVQNLVCDKLLSLNLVIR